MKYIFKENLGYSQFVEVITNSVMNSINYIELYVIISLVFDYFLVTDSYKRSRSMSAHFLKLIHVAKMY
jgi:hypothetical protein